MTSNEFKLIIARIEATWNAPFDNFRKEVYAENLADLDYQKALVVVKKLAQTEKFTPTIAHIREAYAALDNPQVNVIDALSIVNRLMQYYGRYRQLEGMEWLKQQDQVTYEIVKAIGYSNVCDGDPNFLRPEFEKIHREATKEIKETSMLSGKLKSELAQIGSRMQARALQLVAGDEYE